MPVYIHVGTYSRHACVIEYYGLLIEHIIQLFIEHAQLYIEHVQLYIEHVQLYLEYSDSKFCNLIGLLHGL